MESEWYQLLQQAWRGSECPLVDGITFDSGRLVLLKIRSVQVRGLWLDLVDTVGETTIAAFLRDHPGQWASITTLAEVVSEPLGLRLSCGEGSQGGDGFVAASRISDQHLAWIAFFQNSNPFLHLELQASDVLVFNNCEQVWRFPLVRPEACCVVK